MFNREVYAVFVGFKRHLDELTIIALPWNYLMLILIGEASDFLVRYPKLRQREVGLTGEILRTLFIQFFIVVLPTADEHNYANEEQHAQTYSQQHR